MFGWVYKMMDKGEFISRFEGELNEPVDHALTRIQKDIDPDKPPSSDDVKDTILKCVSQYFRHELENQFRKPDENPFKKMSKKDSEDCIRALVMDQLIEWIIQEMVYAKTSNQKITELEETCEEWNEISIKNNWHMQN